MPLSAFAQSASQPTCSITVGQGAVTAGGSVRVSWHSTNAVSGYIAPLGSVVPVGSADVTLNVPGQMTFLGTFSGSGGTANCSASVAVSGNATSVTGSNGSGSGYSSTGYSAGTNYTVTKGAPVTQYADPIQKYTIDPATYQTSQSQTLPSAPSVSASAASGGSPSGTMGTQAQPPNGQLVTNFTAQDPLTNPVIYCYAKGLIGGIYMIGGMIAALWLVYAGFLIVKARGNPAALAKARSNLGKVLIGVFLFCASWLLGVALINTIKAVIPGIFNGVTIPSC